MDALAGICPVRWHFIGALQSNKTRPVAERFDWVHSIDRLSVARRLSEQRPFHAPPLNACIQVALVPEPTKGGVEPGNLAELAEQIAALAAAEAARPDVHSPASTGCALRARHVCPAAGAPRDSQRARARSRYTVDGDERGFRVGDCRRGDDGEDWDGDIRRTVSGTNMHNIRRLAFIGGGNMAAALIGGLTKRGLAERSDRGRRSERRAARASRARASASRARRTTPPRPPVPRP